MATLPHFATVSLRPAVLRGWLVAGWGVLLALTLGAYLAGEGARPPDWLDSWFHLARDNSLLRIYSACLLFILGGLAAFAAGTMPAGRRRARLALLAAFTLGLGMEQVVSFQGYLRDWHLYPLGRYARVVSMLPASLLLVILVRRARRVLPWSLRRRLLAAVVLYLVGTIGLPAYAAYVRASFWLATGYLIAGHAVETLAVVVLLSDVLEHLVAHDYYLLRLAGHASHWSLWARQWSRRLVWLLAALALLSCLFYAAFTARGVWPYGRLEERFYPDSQRSLNNALGGALLLWSALLMTVIALRQRAAHDASWRLWAPLAALLAGLAADELAALHDLLGLILPYDLTTNGLGLMRLMLPALPLLAVGALLSARLLPHLPRRTRWRFGLAAGLYVSGALFVEVLGAYLFLTLGAANPFYFAVVLLEEILEGLAAIVLFTALLDYIGTQWDGVPVIVIESSLPLPAHR